MTLPIQYPTRARIIDVTGKTLHGVGIRTPDVSTPHIGKLGTAEKVDDLNVRITLDDGAVLMGYECWWEPVEVHP